MNATITVVCYKSKTLKNGESPIMLRVCKDNKKKYQSLGISVNPKYWDFSKNEPKPKCPNYEHIQKIILDKKLEVQKKMLDLHADQKEYTYYKDKYNFRLSNCSWMSCEVLSERSY